MSAKYNPFQSQKILIDWGGDDKDSAKDQLSISHKDQIDEVCLETRDAYLIPNLCKEVQRSGGRQGRGYMHWNHDGLKTKTKDKKRLRGHSTTKE